jgi:hypothetical protein
MLAKRGDASRRPSTVAPSVMPIIMTASVMAAPTAETPRNI